MPGRLEARFLGHWVPFWWKSLLHSLAVMQIRNAEILRAATNIWGIPSLLMGQLQNLKWNINFSINDNWKETGRKRKCHKMKHCCSIFREIKYRNAASNFLVRSFWNILKFLSRSQSRLQSVRRSWNGNSYANSRKAQKWIKLRFLWTLLLFY